MYKIKNVSRNLVISGLFPGKEKVIASLTPKIYKLRKEGLLEDKKPYRWNPHVRKWNPLGTPEKVPQNPHEPLWLPKRASEWNRKRSRTRYGAVYSPSGTAE